MATIKIVGLRALRRLLRRIQPDYERACALAMGAKPRRARIRGRR